MKESNSVKLQRLIRDVLIAGEKGGETVGADAVLLREPELIAAWTKERIGDMMRRARLAMQAEDGADAPYQMFFEGFRDLTERLPIKLKRSGQKSTDLASATITHLRGNLRMQRDKASAKAQRTIRLIKGMEPYSRQVRGLTVQRYCELRAADVKPREVKRWVRDQGSDKK